jgi:hypothetical protein
VSVRGRAAGAPAALKGAASSSDCLPLLAPGPEGEPCPKELAADGPW